MGLGRQITQGVLLTVWVLGGAFALKAQEQENIPFEKDLFKDSLDNWRGPFKDAEDHLEEGNEIVEEYGFTLWRRALDHYLKAYDFNPNSAWLNFRIGQCYIHGSTDKFKSLQYFQKAYQLKPGLDPRIHFFLGWSWHLREKWDKAIYHYELYRKTLDQQKQSGAFLKVNKRMRECRNGKELKKDSVRVWIDNLGDSVNTEYPEYGPVINADGSLLLFTSRRPGTTGGEKDERLGEYFEDIYYVKRKGENAWTEAKNFGEPINTDEHDATVCIAPDGRRMMVYRGDDQTIYESRLKKGKWKEPDDETTDDHINSDFKENSAWYSYNGKRLYFVSTRTDLDTNLGGKDIFVSDWDPDDEEWGPARNVGVTVNTQYNEDGVFMHPDGKTMYFSSEGHRTMGGYDIFRTEKLDNGNWSEPENIGYPINTPDNDVFFVVGSSGRKAYYSSIRKGGHGEKDLYQITFLGPEKEPVLNSEDNLVASIADPLKKKVVEPQVEVRESNLTLVKGKVRDSETKDPLKASLEIVDNEKNEVVSRTKSKKGSGKYLVSLPAGKNYGIAVKKDGYLFHSEHFNIPDTAAYQEYVKNIDLMRIEVGNKVILKNIFFDYDEHTLRDASIPELERLIRLLEENDDIRIEISGHTDNRGSKAYNQKLSKKRARSVVEYLTEHGVDGERLSYKGYGQSKPIATNKTEEGRQKNRRTEFKIVAAD